MLLIDQEATLAAIPDLLPPDREARRQASTALRRVLSAAGDMTAKRRKDSSALPACSVSEPTVPLESRSW